MSTSYKIEIKENVWLEYKAKGMTKIISFV